MAYPPNPDRSVIDRLMVAAPWHRKSKVLPNIEAGASNGVFTKVEAKKAICDSELLCYVAGYRYEIGTPPQTKTATGYICNDNSPPRYPKWTPTLTGREAAAGAPRPTTQVAVSLLTGPDEEEHELAHGAQRSFDLGRNAAVQLTDQSLSTLFLGTYRVPANVSIIVVIAHGMFEGSTGYPVAGFNYFKTSLPGAVPGTTRDVQRYLARPDPNGSGSMGIAHEFKPLTEEYADPTALEHAIPEAPGQPEKQFSIQRTRYAAVTIAQNELRAMKSRAMSKGAGRVVQYPTGDGPFFRMHLLKIDYVRLLKEYLAQQQPARRFIVVMATCNGFDDPSIAPPNATDYKKPTFDELWRSFGGDAPAPGSTPSMLLAFPPMGYISDSSMHTNYVFPTLKATAEQLLASGFLVKIVFLTV